VIAGLTWWLVPDVRRRTRRASRSGHDIAASGLQTDLPAAEARSFAFWSPSNVAVYLRPTEEQASAGKQSAIMCGLMCGPVGRD
jgi:hypothetical protein